MKTVMALITCLMLMACGQSDVDKVETVVVSSGLFEIILHADGELRAAQSTPIKPPPASAVIPAVT